jgi:hypothetical protein
MAMLTTTMDMLMVTMPTNRTVTRTMPICMARRPLSLMSICDLRYTMKTPMHTTIPRIQAATYTPQITHPHTRTTTPIPIRTRNRILTIHILILIHYLMITGRRILQFVAASPTHGVLPFKYPLMAIKSRLPFRFPSLPPVVWTRQFHPVILAL